MDQSNQSSINPQLQQLASLDNVRGKKQYTVENGYLREIQPGPDLFFTNTDKNQSYDPAKKQKMKLTTFKNFSMDPNSKIYNYRIKDILVLFKLYAGQMSPEVLNEIESHRNGLRRRFTLAKQFFVGYTLYLLTVGRTIKWARLTSTRSKYFMLFYSGSVALLTPLAMQSNEVFHIFRFHQQYQKILDLYQKDAKLI